MIFRFYIDDELLQEHPNGWNDFTIDLIRNYEERFIYAEYNSSLTLYPTAGWEQVYAYIIANDYGKLINFSAQYSEDETTWTTFIDGLIDIADIEFDLNRYTAKVNIIDRSIATYINKNKSLKVTTGGSTSKNGETISNPSFPSRLLQLETKQGTNSRFIWPIESDALLDYVVSYISDNKLTVVNNWYDSLSRKLYFIPLGALIKGVEEIEVKSDYVARPEIKAQITTSFSECFTDLSKLFNTFMTVVYNGTNYVLHVDEEADTYNNTTAFVLNDISRETLRINGDRFYTDIEVGQDEVKKAGVDYLTGASLYSWSRTNIQLKGQSNLRQSVLQLNTSFVYSALSIFSYAVRIDALDTTDSIEYALSYNTSSSGQKNVLLEGDSGTITAQTLNKSVYLGEADANAEVVDIENIEERELLQDVVNVTEKTAMLNQLMTNDEVVARYAMPFDTFLSANPDPAVDATLKLNANITGLQSIRNRTFELNTVDNLLPLRSDISGASDPYNQWSNTDYRFKPSSLSGRIDEFLISGTVSVNVSFTSTEGFKMVLYIVHLIDGVPYYDQVSESITSTSTGVQSLSVAGRRYVPFTDDGSFQFLAACVPNGDAFVTNNDWGNNWTLDATYVSYSSTELIVDFTGFPSGTTQVTYDIALEITGDYRVSFDYPAPVGIVSVQIRTSTTTHHTITPAGFAGSFDGTFSASAPATFNLLFTMDADSVFVLENFILSKIYTVDYSIQASGTSFLVEQVGFDGSSYTNASPSTYKGYELEIEGNTTIADFKNSMDDPRKRIEVNGRYGWPLSLTFTPAKGTLKGTLISDHTNLGL